MRTVPLKKKAWVGNRSGQHTARPTCGVLFLRFAEDSAVIDRHYSWRTENRSKEKRPESQAHGVLRLPLPALQFPLAPFVPLLWSFKKAT